MNTTPADQSAARALSPVQIQKAEPLPCSAVWALLWSQSQNALHVEPIEDMLASNRRAYGEDRRMDYVPVCIDREEVVRQMADGIRNTMKVREIERSQRREVW